MTDLAAMLMECKGDVDWGMVAGDGTSALEARAAPLAEDWSFFRANERADMAEFVGIVAKACTGRERAAYQAEQGQARSK